MATRRFELIDGTSRKFWEIWLDGGAVCTRYGRLGSAGQTTQKEEGDPARARKLYEKLVAEKTKKGYAEVLAPALEEPAPQAAPSPPPAAPEAAPEVAPRPAAPAAPKTPPAKKPLKAPKKTSPEYQALARGFRELLTALTAEDLDAAAVDARLAELMADPAVAAVADAERVLGQLAPRELRDRVSADEELRKLFKDDPPEQLAEALARNAAAAARQRLRTLAKHRVLVRLLEAGCDPKKAEKGEERTPLEAFVFTLPLANHLDYAAFPWSGPDEPSALAVLEAFAAAGDDGSEGAALTEAALLRWPAFDALLASHPSAPALLGAWGALLTLLRASQGDDRAGVLARLPALAAELVARGAGGASHEDGAGALTVALTRGALPAVRALADAGVDLDAPSERRVACTVQVPTQHLPGGERGVRQWQRLAFAAGFTARDVAESTLDAYDGWESFLGDRDGAAFGTLGAQRRRDHAEVRALVEALAAEGRAVSGRRRPRSLVAGEPIPAGFKAAVDAALVGVVARLGGDGAAATTELAALDPGAFGALAYLRDAGAAAASFLPRSVLPRVGAAWLKETLGFDDGLVGPDPSALGDFPPEARPALTSGAWLATRGSDVAVLEKSGRVVEASVRGGLVELAPDLAAFVTKDLGAIV